MICSLQENLSQEFNMTDYEILVTVAVVAVIFAVKVWILTKI